MNYVSLYKPLIHTLCSAHIQEKLNPKSLYIPLLCTNIQCTIKGILTIFCYPYIQYILHEVSLYCRFESLNPIRALCYWWISGSRLWITDQKVVGATVRLLSKVLHPFCCIMADSNGAAVLWLQLPKTLLYAHKRLLLYCNVSPVILPFNLLDM